MLKLLRHYGSWVSSLCLRSALAVVTTAIVLTTVLLAAQSAVAQTFTVLYTFKGSPDGANPRAALIRDAKGNLYGSTVGGGVTNCQSSGCGVAFKLDATGKETVLHRFRKGQLGGGTNPIGRLVRDAMGNLYGAAAAGGFDCGNLPGCGAVFELDKTGKETVLHYFKGLSDGAGPGGGLARDGAGNFYGTTAEGGGSGCGRFGCGTVFTVNQNNGETVLHEFTGGTDGAVPEAAVIRDSAGNLYGTTTQGGGTGCGGDGCGTLFKVNQNHNETVLHDFTGGTDGAVPWASLVRDSAGNLYGTTTQGGGTGCGGNGCGTVFTVNQNNGETVLHDFTGGTDGAVPAASLVRDSAGNLYGTTLSGGGTGCGGSGCGTVFKLDTAGTETVLYSFTGGADGANPATPLLLDSSGNLYGTALQGGTGCGNSGCGVVFKLIP